MDITEATLEELEAELNFRKMREVALKSVPTAVLKKELENRLEG